MYKIGIVGDGASVIGFMAVGFTVVTVETPEQAVKAVAKLAEDDHAIIFITEEFAMQCEEALAKYRSLPLPALITIPGKNGSTGYGMAGIKESVERAIGADILFNN